MPPQSLNLAYLVICSGLDHDAEIPLSDWLMLECFSSATSISVCYSRCSGCARDPGRYIPRLLHPLCHYFQYHKCMYELQSSTSNNALQAHIKFSMSSSLERVFPGRTGSVLLWSLQLYLSQLFSQLHVFDRFFSLT